MKRLMAAMMIIATSALALGACTQGRGLNPSQATLTQGGSDGGAGGGGY